VPSPPVRCRWQSERPSGSTVGQHAVSMVAPGDDGDEALRASAKKGMVLHAREDL
jgi:hypothetical protein